MDQSRRKSMALIVVRLIVLVQPPFNTVQYEKVEYYTMQPIKIMQIQYAFKCVLHITKSWYVLLATIEISKYLLKNI